MAYASLISLENTIHRFLNDDRVSIPVEGKQPILSLLEHVSSFQVFLEEFPDRFNSLEGRMREVADDTEDILEYLVLEKVTHVPAPVSDDEEGHLPLEKVSSASDDQNEIQVSISLDDENEDKVSSYSVGDELKIELEKAMGEIGLIAREVKKVKGSSNTKEVQRAFSSSSSASASGPSISKDVMVNFEDYVMDVKERLCADQSKLQVIPICGMGGIGKTTLARHIYDDPLIIETFHVRVWVTVSQDYSPQRILSNLLESLKDFNKGISGETSEKVYRILICRKYLIVMDDIWNREAWDVVRNVFPSNGNGSRVLLTTRLSDMASYPDSSSKLCEMHLMDADQSWVLFKKKVCGNEDCPSELECIGKEIARNCGGLPLAIVVIAGVVSTVSRNVASWQEIAENVKNSADQNRIEDILSLSYFQLPQYLRPCFLYMGSFTEDEEINVTKLIKLWVAEGFLKSPTDSDKFEMMAEECLEELVKRNLVLVIKKKYDGRIKSCGLHDMMRDLCITKVHESKFFLNLTNRPHLEEKTFLESIKDHRRLSVNTSNIRHLSSCSSTTIHSIRCWVYSLVNMKYSVGSVRLLRVLDAEPADVEDSQLMKQASEFFHLRYLAITYSGSGLNGLLNLRNLQTLIIHMENQIGFDYILWLEWSICHNLRHVHFDGLIHFRDPEETTCSLGSLQTVSYVSQSCCTERILKKIPNIKKLKVDCSGGPHQGKTACLNDLVHLQRLESLELYAGYWFQSRPEKYNLGFHKMLKKLCLTDLVFPWNDIVVVDSLPNLQVLKLKCCTCVGGTWEITEGEFPQVEFLLIKSCNLENWMTESSHFPRLRRLLLHYCRHLNAIPNDIGDISTLELIEVKGGKESLVKSAEVIQNEQEENGNETLQVICLV